MSARTAEGPYVIEHGEVWYVNQGPSTPGGRAMRLGRHHVCGPSENLAMAFDEEDGILHRHGTEASVRAWIENLRRRTAGLPPEMSLPVPTMLTFPPTAETVAEMNLCIATTGRIKRLYPNGLAAVAPLPGGSP